MRVTVPAVALLLAACDGSPSPPAGSSPVEKEPLPTDPSEAIGRVLKLKCGSYHIFLREASLLVPPLLKGQPWDDVAALMKRHGFPAVKAWSNGDAVHSHHRMAEKFIEFPGGGSLDLCLLLSAPNQNRGSFDAKPGALYAAHVALVADPRAPWEEVVERRLYPKETVIGKALAAVSDPGKVWPFIRTITVYYDVLWSRREEWHPSGFEIIVEFAASLEEEVGGKNQWLKVTSGLDPWKSRHGMMPGQDWTSADTLGDINPGGSNEWWHGTRDLVERNREKHLRTRK